MNTLPHIDNVEFKRRHIGITDQDVSVMLKEIGLKSLSDLIENTIPSNILTHRKMNLPPAHSEHEALQKLSQIMSKNQIAKSYIGLGYHPTITPSVIRRHILENPGWYTQYTPYQAEIAQGRLEALINFQTMVCDLTAMPLANASLLDEATAAAEAMSMAFHIQSQLYKKKSNPLKTKLLMSIEAHPSTIEVLKTRMQALGLEISLKPQKDMRAMQDFSDYFALILQYPDTYGEVIDHTDLVKKAQNQGCLSLFITDLLALTLLKPPGEMGADIVVGNTQRFGVQMGFGGPHAAFLASKEAYKRHIPGRIVGISKDKFGKPAYRLTLQTREQHIRREKATSNICTAQTLLAVMASMYACWHGPEGLRNIARCILEKTHNLKKGLEKRQVRIINAAFFDTLKIQTSKARAIFKTALQKSINLRYIDPQTLGISLNETTTDCDVQDILKLFDNIDAANPQTQTFEKTKDHPKNSQEDYKLPAHLARTSSFLDHPVFNSYHSETQMLRYIRRLQSRDLSLIHSMIPLGSCTMKLNAASQMIPLTWPTIGNIHPFAPSEQTNGYLKVMEQLEAWLAECVGFDATSLQPNAGSQGEYAGLLVIKKYHQSQGQGHRYVCLIPESAHGTNPASAVIAGFQVVVVKCDKNGNIDLQDFQNRLKEHQENLAAMMITYPSTHGVFELTIKEICEHVHKAGGQVYLDGANMNAQIGLCFPGDYGPDVCHLNLHKTFAIPHGGGGPGVGPVVVKKHLQPFLPFCSPKAHLPKVEGKEDSQMATDSMSDSIGMISQAPYGSGSICNISWMYILMLGTSGLKKASKIAILNANYIAKRLQPYFAVLYKGHKGYVAHECILDLRPWQKHLGMLVVEDVAKRLMDYGFHAPTMSWPVPGTLMIEPTESESKAEIDRFCEAMICIHGELVKVESGEFDKNDNPLKQAPHTLSEVCSDQWSHAYSRQVAAFPLPYLKEDKFWPSVSRIDNVYGDKNLFCTCLMPS